MKRKNSIITIFILFLLASGMANNGYAQKNPVELLTEEKGQSTRYFAKSFSKVPMYVQLTLEGTGFTSEKGTTIVEMVKPLAKQEIAVIQKDPAQPFSIRVSFACASSPLAFENKTSEVQKEEETPPMPALGKGLVIFTKNGCGRCTSLVSALQKDEIIFQEINLSTEKDMSPLMWQKLEEAGYTAKTVTTPVVLIEGKAQLEKDLKILQQLIRERFAD